MTAGEVAGLTDMVTRAEKVLAQVGADLNAAWGERQRTCAGLVDMWEFKYGSLDDEDSREAWLSHQNPRGPYLPEFREQQYEFDVAATRYAYMHQFYDTVKAWCDRLSDALKAKQAELDAV